MDSVKGYRLTFDEVCDIVEPIAAKYDVRRVYLFGSRSRGDDHFDSDYDFCILPGKSCSILDLSGFVCDLKEALGSEIDIVSERFADTEFIEFISTDRKLVYEG